MPRPPADAELPASAVAEVMTSVTVSASWDMGHRLPNHQGQCRFCHGHRYVVEITIDGAVCTTFGASDEGMVVDFSTVKNELRAEIAKLDHRFLVSTQDEFAERMVELPGVVFVPYVPTAENIALALLKALPGVVRVKLWETPTSFAEVTR